MKYLFLFFDLPGNTVFFLTEKIDVYWKTKKKKKRKRKKKKDTKKGNKNSRRDPQTTCLISYEAYYELASDNLPSMTLLLSRLHEGEFELLQKGNGFARSKWTRPP